MINNWTFIDTGYNSGCYNMDIDEKLLRNYTPKSLPVFRFYSWYPPVISLGRFQNHREVLDIDECRRDSIDIVRRPTGGGAIFHNKDLSYSIICDADIVGERMSVKDSYKKLCYFLILSYRELGFSTCFADEDGVFIEDHKKADFCFAGMEKFDILINGRKIGGNAQKRCRKIIFQHGSIPFNIDNDIEKYFKKPIDYRWATLTTLKIEEFKKILLKNFEKLLAK